MGAGPGVGATPQLLTQHAVEGEQGQRVVDQGDTGGRLTTIEYDAARAKLAAAHVRAAGLADVVTVIAGDAFAEIPKLEGALDFVFLDAWKRDYKRFLDLMLPRLAPRGLFLAHNVVNKQSEMRDFLDAIKTDPRLFTTIVTPSSEGMSVSVKVK